MSKDRRRLEDIREAIEKIEQYAPRGREAFDTDELVRIWIVHHLEIIGEAVRSISPELKDGHPEVPWIPISRMRNILVHVYDAIDYDLVWSVVQDNLPTLKADIHRLLQEGSGQGSSAVEG